MPFVCLLLAGLLTAGAWGADDLPSAIQRVGDAVVTITAPVGGNKATVGAGFIVDPGGSIVTNAHVVGSATKVTVKLADGSEVPGTVAAKAQNADIALVKIERAHMPSAQFGSSASLAKGELVAALGSPLGLEGSVSRGSVSNPKQEVQGKTFIQIDVALNPGNSGGPLINDQGLVVGMNTKIAAGAQNVGFAIPAEEVCKFLDEQNVAYSASMAPPPGASKAEGGKTEGGKTEGGGKAGTKAGPLTPTPAPETPEEPFKPWMVLLASAVISLVVGVLAGTLAARATVKNLARSVVTTPGGGYPPTTPGVPGAPGGQSEDLSDVDIKLY